MIQIYEKEKCCGCSACAQKCPKHAIKMQKDQEGFLYPIVDITRCVECGLCENVCPEIKPAIVSDHTQVYACYRNDFDKRIQSASGGIFAVMAENILRAGGVVFGAAFDENWNIRHIAIEQEDQLQMLQGSKYVQSVIGKTYKQAEKALRDGRKVLFSGTPCQIQGLRRYLGKDYENLMLVDLICHGVPSNDIWQAYLKEISKGRKIVSFIPRDKSKGIENAPLVFEFENGDFLREKYDKNVYISGFNQNLYLRPSCHTCSFKGIDRCSDITIGDFWGLGDYKPEFSDQYGISAVLIHTETGKKIFEKIRGAVALVECKAEMLSPQNPCVLASVQPHVERTRFFELMPEQGFRVTVKKLLRPSIRQRMNKAFKVPRYYIWVVKQKLKR